MRCHTSSLSLGLGGCNTKMNGHGKRETWKRKEGREEERKEKENQS